MSFLGKLKRKNKHGYHIAIFIQGMTNLPLHLEGTSLQVQLKRKDKVQCTKYSLVSRQKIAWHEAFEFDCSFWQKSSDINDGYEDKLFDITITSLTNEKDILVSYSINLSDFVKHNSRTEQLQTLVQPLNSTDKVEYAHKKQNQVIPRLNMVIRAYSEGVNYNRASDFSDYYETTDTFINPLQQKEKMARQTAVIIDTATNVVRETPHDVTTPRHGEESGDKSRHLSVLFNDTIDRDQHRGSLMNDTTNAPGKRQSTIRFSIAAGNQTSPDQDDVIYEDGHDNYNNKNTTKNGGKRNTLLDWNSFDHEVNHTQGNRGGYEDDDEF